MKNLIKTILPVLLMAVFVLIATSGFAQDPPPPPPSGGHGMGGTQPPGGGAPIGEGIFILTLLGAAYGGKKWFTNKKNDRIKSV